MAYEITVQKGMTGLFKGAPNITYGTTLMALEIQQSRFMATWPAFSSSMTMYRKNYPSPKNMEKTIFHSSFRTGDFHHLDYLILTKGLTTYPSIMDTIYPLEPMVLDKLHI